MPKLYNITNLKTGQVYKNKSQAQIDALKAWIPDKATPHITGLSAYSVEEFEVGDPNAKTFKPELPPLFPKAVPTKEETKGPAAAGQTT